jgi:hypothetical protein
MGSAILTFGEIIFNSVGSFVVLRMIPKSNKQGSIYGTILILQTSLRIFGGAIAFPWIVHGSHPLAVILIAGGIGYLLWIYLRPHLVNIQ